MFAKNCHIVALREENEDLFASEADACNKNGEDLIKC